MLAPILASRSHYWASDLDREREEAHERLEASLAWAAEQGFAAKGEVGDPDPLLAIEDELRDFGADEVIIVRHYRERTSWLANRMLGHLARELDVPVREIALGDDRDRSPSRPRPRRNRIGGPWATTLGAFVIVSPSPLSRPSWSVWGASSGSSRTRAHRPRNGRSPRRPLRLRARRSTRTSLPARTTSSQFACTQCHGDQGRGGVSPAVPALTSVAKALTPAELRSIIDHGLGESSNPTQPYMPVWGAVISKTQVSDLIAYLRAGLPAVPTAEPPTIPQGQGAAVEGAALYVRYGCVNCHGPNGLGGVPNPQSPDKTIPPLSGQDFRKEFNTDAKIIAMIRSGSVIGRAPIVSMPHWGGIIPEDQLRALVAYIKTLK